MRRPFLNIDAGEYPDEPEDLFALADVVSIACGGHAGDDDTMRLALARCARFATRAGAHPSFADRESFGRRPQAITPDALRVLVRDQCARLALHAGAAGLTIAHVKPHGALYHAADADPALANALVAGAVDALGAALTCIGPPSGALAEAARAMAIAFAREGFADRGVGPDGKLLPRGQPGAVLSDPEGAAARATALASSGRVDTLCVHGDTPNAVEIAAAVGRALGAR